jgi:hypothetical protein
MQKKFVQLLLLSIVLLACTCSVPSIIPALKTPTANGPSGGGGQTMATGFVIVQLNPRDGSLTMQLSSEVQKAAAQGLKPFVEWDAEW